MKYKNPKFKFLNTNPNPTLAELRSQFKETEKSNKHSLQKLSSLAFNLKKDIQTQSVPKGILDVMEQIQQKIEEKAFSEARDKIKNGLKRIKLLKKDKQIQQKIENLYSKIEKKIDEKHEITRHEKALLLLCDLIFLNHSIYTPLSKIKEEVTDTAFNLYIGFQTIGCVSGDGWAFGVFGNMPQMVPYIPNVMQLLGYPKVAQAISNTINTFPKDVEFLFGTEEYTDVLNFIENPRHPIETSLLNHYSQQQREIMNAHYIKALNHIEEVEDEIWNDESEWIQLAQYYDENLEKKIWRDTNDICKLPTI